jgi:surfactin synthase thioesterase subunit
MPGQSRVAACAASPRSPRIAAIDSPWILRRQPRSDPKLRLLCFPNAGRGASMFSMWSAALPASIEVCAVQLPGRESRMTEPAEPSLGSLLPKLVDALAPVRAGAYAIYGHSIGALVAFEFTRELRRRGERLPVHLIVSARRAPQCTPLPALSYLGDPELLRELTLLYGPLHPAILADRDFLALSLRSIRADLRLADAHRDANDPPLPLPLSAYGGRRDISTDEDLLRAWGAHTSAAFNLRLFDGDHFFPDAARGEVARAMAEDLAHAL